MKTLFLYHLPNMMYSHGMYANSKDDVVKYLKEKSVHPKIIERAKIHQHDLTQVKSQEIVDAWLEEPDFAPKRYTNTWQKINQTQYVVKKDNGILIVEIEEECTLAGDFVVHFSIKPVSKTDFVQGLPLREQFDGLTIETTYQYDKQALLDTLDEYDIDFDWLDIDDYRDPEDTPEDFPENDWDE